MLHIGGKWWGNEVNREIFEKFTLLWIITFVIFNQQRVQQKCNFYKTKVWWLVKIISLKCM